MSRRHAMYDAAGRVKRAEIAASQAAFECATDKIEPGDTVKYLKVGPTKLDAKSVAKLQALVGQTGVAQANFGKFDKGGSVKFKNGDSPWLYPEQLQLVKKGKGAPKSPAGPKQGKFKDGQKVKLKPFEGEPAQTGVVDGYDAKSKTYIVTVDKQYRKRGDDGLREVSESQLG